MSRKIENDLKNAFEGLCPDVFEDILSKCETKKGTVMITEKPNKRRILRPLLIAAAAALLIAALLIPVGIALAKKPAPEPTPEVPVENVSEEKTPTPVETPTPTPTPDEPSTIEVVSPTEQKKVLPASALLPESAALGSGWSDVIDFPIAIVKILEITDNTKNSPLYDDLHWYEPVPVTQVKIETIYVKGGYYSLFDSSYSDLLKDCIFWIPSEIIDELSVGDILLCDSFSVRRQNRIINIYSNYRMADYRLVDGYFKPFYDVSGHLESYGRSLRQINRLIEEGYTFEFTDKDGITHDFSELFERLPKPMLFDGNATIEDVIEMCEWFEDLRNCLVEEKVISLESAKNMWSAWNKWRN